MWEERIYKNFHSLGLLELRQNTYMTFQLSYRFFTKQGWFIIYEIKLNIMTELQKSSLNGKKNQDFLETKNHKRRGSLVNGNTEKRKNLNVNFWQETKFSYIQSDDFSIFLHRKIFLPQWRGSEEMQTW